MAKKISDRTVELEKNILELKNEREENIKQTNKLEVANRELSITQDQLIHAEKMTGIGRLAGGIAHDFNNLLTSVKGYAELLHCMFENDPNVQKKLQIIIMSADRGADLTKKLLGFARKGVLNIQTLNVQKVIEDAVSLLSASINKATKIQTDFFPDLWDIRGDSSQVLQVLMNLGINAKDAMPKGGDLTFEAENIMVDETLNANSPDVKPGPYVRITVRDTGEGISKKIIKKIFDPFFTTKDVGKGTGLDLSMVYGIMMVHQGKIDVHSTKDHGTCFHLYFPANFKQSAIEIKKSKI